MLNRLLWPAQGVASIYCFYGMCYLWFQLYLSHKDSPPVPFLYHRENGRTEVREAGFLPWHLGSWVTAELSTSVLQPRGQFLRKELAALELGPSEDC